MNIKPSVNFLHYCTRQLQNTGTNSCMYKRCGQLNRIQCYSKRNSDISLRLPTNPNLGDDLPENVYEGEHYKRRTRVYTWGVASHGALARPSLLNPENAKQKVTECRKHPHRSSFGEKHRVLDGSCGYGFTVFAVKNEGKLTCYGTGLNADGQLGHHVKRSGERVTIVIEPQPIPVPVESGESVVKVTCGRAHTLALTDKGNAFTFGNNVYGQCGRPVIANEDYGKHTIYTKVKDIKVQQIEAGQDTSFFLGTDGKVYSCGWGADGQTGRGHYTSDSEVGPLGADLEGVKVVKVSSRADCALALSDKGEVFGWGNNEYQQLALSCNEPQQCNPRHLPLPSYVGRVIDVACGGTSCFVVNDEGKVYSWGYGTLGRGPANVFSQTPELIPPTLLGTNELTPDNYAISVSCGVHMAMCLTNAGDVYSWGKNRGGCLGQGHNKNQDYPIKVIIPCKAIKVSCGVDHALALAKEL